MKCHGFYLVLVLIPFLLLGASFAKVVPDIGVFPFLVVSQNRDELQEIELNEEIAELLVSRLNQGGSVRAVFMEWPEGEEVSSSQRVRFNALLAAARKAGLHSFILGGVTAFDLETKDTASSIMDRIKKRVLDKGKISIAEARVTIEGALIDTITQQVLEPFKGESKKKDMKYSGLDLAGLSGINIMSQEFGETLLGKAADEAIKKASQQIQAKADQISRGPVLPVPRQNPPPGLAFTQSQFFAQVERSGNQWIEIEVYNGGSSEARFVLRAQSPQNLPVGFLGSGSIDIPCFLPAGEWKRIRMIVMAGEADRPDYEIPIELFSMDSSGKIDFSSTKSHDRATVLLNIFSPDFTLKVEWIKENTATLAQSYRITNNGGPLGDFSVSIPEEFSDKVISRPSISYYPLSGGESVEVTFSPRLFSRFARLEARAVLSSGSHKQILPLTFEVPRGKKVFLAEGLSSQSYDSDNQYCTNSGGKNTPIGGPENPPCTPSDIEQMKLLEEIIEEKEKTRDLYKDLAGQAKDCDDLDDKVKKALEDWLKDRCPNCIVEEGGSFDPNTGKIHCPPKCLPPFSFPKPMCEWLDEACQAHEKQHQEDDPLFGRSDKPSRCAQKEENGYNAEINVLKKYLNELKERCEGGGAATGHSFSGSAPLDDFGPLMANQGITDPKGTETWRNSGGPLRRPSCLTVIHPFTEEELRSRFEEAGYYLSASFTLPYSRSTYTPHDTRVFLNGYLVGEILDDLPEGTYLWPINPLYLTYGGKNLITTKIERINEAHYILANKFRLITPVTEEERLVIASSQEEANKLYSILPHINHDTPDLIVLANSIRNLPRDPKPGQKISFKVNVMNIGEAASLEGKLRIFNSDPTKKVSQKVDLSEGIVSAMSKLAYQQFSLDEVARPMQIPSLLPGQRIEIPVEITYLPGRITRLHLMADTQGKDHDPTNNIMDVTFISQDKVSPLAGVDWPQIMDVPILVRVLELPNVPEVESLIATTLSNLVDKIPYLREL